MITISWVIIYVLIAWIGGIIVGLCLTSRNDSRPYRSRHYDWYDD